MRLTGRNGNRLQIEGLDALDQTPLLDLKPSIPHADHAPVDRIGWLEDTGRSFAAEIADRRFHCD